MKDAKKLVLLAILVLAATFIAKPSYALDSTSYHVTSHTISIQINPDTTDTVVEKFYIAFANDAAKKDFRDKSTALGTIIDEWTKLNPLFTASLGTNAANKKISYNEGDPSYLQISYDLTEPLMAKGKEATLMTEYTIKADYFNSFYQTGLWVIPENTTISIELPPGAEVKDAIEPEATVTANGARKVVTWQGYKSGNKLTMTYLLWKKIDTVIDLNAINSFLFKTQEGIILMIVAVLVIIAIVLQRKRIARGIEEYVEKNSEIREE